MKDSSVLRAADGLPGRVRSAAERLSRAASCGRTSGRCLRSAAPPFSDLPAPEAPTGAAPPILAAMTTRARRRRAGRLWWPDLQLVEVNGARLCADEPSPEATRVTCSCRIRCWAPGCASDLGPLSGGRPDAQDAGPAVSLRVWTVDRLTQRARRLSGAG